jgi:hypothetical protein
VHVQVLAARGPRLILEMPGACFLPEHEPYVSAIFRHILEDPVTLQAAMEAEIRNTLSARGQHADAAGLLQPPCASAVALVPADKQVKTYTSNKAPKQCFSFSCKQGVDHRCRDKALDAAFAHEPTFCLALSAWALCTTLRCLCNAALQ